MFNIDKTRFDPTKTEVVDQINASSSKVAAGPAQKSTTVLISRNADGEKLPALIALKKNNVWDTWMVPQETTLNIPKACYAASASGWMKADIINNYFKKAF